MKKYSRKISIDNLKILLARSGNQCSFSDCLHPIFDDNNLFIAQLCHIEAVSPNGQRYNPNKSDEEINSFENLLFLCYRHHKVTDNVDLYPVEKLKEIKTNHEAKFKEATYEYPKEVLTNLESEIENFWTDIDKLHLEHIIPELSVPINTKSDILTLITEICEFLEHLTQVNSVLISECKATHFEYVCLALPNLLTRISVGIQQIEIKYLEEQILKKPDNEELLNKLKKVRKEFENIAKYIGLAD
jgi:hypothetical protein